MVRRFYDQKNKNTVPWTYVVEDLHGEEIIEMFYEKELQKTKQIEFRIVKVIRKKGDKLYTKVMKILFNNWIDKKRYHWTKWPIIEEWDSYSKNKIIKVETK